MGPHTLCPCDANHVNPGGGRGGERRVKRLYRRQMSLPLVGNEDLFPEMREAFGDDQAGLEEALKAHARASKMVSESRRGGGQAVGFRFPPTAHG